MTEEEGTESWLRKHSRLRASFISITLSKRVSQAFNGRLSTLHFFELHTTTTKDQDTYLEYLTDKAIIFHAVVVFGWNNCMLFICLFQGWDGYWGLPLFPTLPDERVCICRDPKSCEFPRHHYSGLRTRTWNHVVFWVLRLPWLVSPVDLFENDWMKAVYHSLLLV